MENANWYDVDTPAEADLAKKNIKLLIDMKEANTFKLVKDYFDMIKIDFWIEAGTALGIYRDGQILPWDHDIDIGIWYDDLKDYIELKTILVKGFDVVIQKEISIYR